MLVEPGVHSGGIGTVPGSDQIVMPHLRQVAEGLHLREFGGIELRQQIGLTVYQRLLFRLQHIQERLPGGAFPFQLGNQGCRAGWRIILRHGAFP